MKFLIRFILLLVIILMIAIGGYLSASADIDQAASDSVGAFTRFMHSLDSGVLLRGLLLWARTFGGRFLVVEVPKRLLLFFFVPYVIIWLLPVRWHRWTRRNFSFTTYKLKGVYRHGMLWLRTEMFGPYTGYALGLIVAGIFFVLFYSLFWTYLALWLGFVRIPTSLIRTVSFAGRWAASFLQKRPFISLAFTWGARLSRWVDDKIPQVRWTPTPESKRNRARRLARKAIKLRRLKRKLQILNRHIKPVQMEGESVEDAKIKTKAR